jgi:hypothetical protein
MSHLIFDTRDWKFILNDVLDVSEVTALEKYQDFDPATLEEILDQAVKFAVERMAPVNAIGDRQGCECENGRVTTPEIYTGL